MVTVFPVDLVFIDDDRVHVMVGALFHVFEVDAEFAVGRPSSEST